MVDLHAGGMSRAIVVTAIVCGFAAAAAAATPGQATLREARVAIVFSPGACDVTSHFAIDTVEPVAIDHRVMLGDDGRPPEFVVLGALAGQAERIGRTASLRVSLTGTGRNEYTVRYRLIPHGARRDRCPMIVPSVATDGLSRAVAIAVEVPRGAPRLPGEFPAFTWDNERGRITLGHMPSFVRVPLAAAGAPITSIDALDLRRATDVAAILAIGAATLAWLTLRKPRT
jgi:hypothetical protein